MPRPIANGRPIRWGILGAGTIADTFSSDINLTAGNLVTAVAAREHAAPHVSPPGTELPEVTATTRHW
jgi:predicted homoserine dehydrogenase-like protein